MCPRLYTFDFERLYTNIPSGDMHSKIMQLIGKVFADHPGHAGIKIWEQAPAEWLTAAQMHVTDAEQYGTGYAGRFYIYDWLPYMSFCAICWITCMCSLEMHCYSRS